MGTISLCIDNTFNDLVLSAAGDIAVVNDPYRLAQDAACFIRLFQGELFFDATQGLPFWQQILGHYPPLTLVKYYFQQAALQVPGVASANVYITGFTKRSLSGQVQVRDANGNVSIASF
jgi:hypothetical protein